MKRERGFYQGEMLIRALTAKQLVEIHDIRFTGDFGVPLPPLKKSLP